jgi:hypothetical protein
MIVPNIVSTLLEKVARNFYGPRSSGLPETTATRLETWEDIHLTPPGTLVGFNGGLACFVNVNAHYERGNGITLVSRGEDGKPQSRILVCGEPRVVQNHRTIAQPRQIILETLTPSLANLYEEMLTEAGL